ncbi:hypothetical protein BP6252_08681 [Coleophoma cylindrospora]|uniref:Uncharacterized protein n=1 Tax=Coleophoma cylindrospora TaxID=1849047 RepID=A0A3D8R6T8_9HELO|nr:hypothetical protein BP6252_08681 [Coleophoma cylindrospora]
MPELKAIHGTYYLWMYVPSIPGSAIAALLWAAVGTALAWKMFRARSWFCAGFVVGCFLECIGYIARAAAAYNTDKIMPYVIQNLFILLPPALFAATIYICLGRVIRLVEADHLSPVRPRRLTFIFGGSAAFSVMADKNTLFPIIAEAMVVGGLGIQLVSFCLFGLTALVFHQRLKRAPTTASNNGDQQWRGVMCMLYGVSALIVVRSIFRIVEYVLGSTGYPLRHEWTLYLFDTIPMLAVSVFFFLCYPICLVRMKQQDGVPLEESAIFRASLMPK